MAKHTVKKRKMSVLHLTRLELLHLRDMMSILLPPDATKTLSTALAEVENRPVVESMLWKKIASACEDAGLPMGHEAPDFMVAPTGAPPIGVFQVASEPMEEIGGLDSDDEEV